MADRGQSRWERITCVCACRAFLFFMYVSSCFCVLSVLTTTSTCMRLLLLPVCVCVCVCVWSCEWLIAAWWESLSVTLQQWRADNHLPLSRSGARQANKHTHIPISRTLAATHFSESLFPTPVSPTCATFRPLALLNLYSRGQTSIPCRGRGCSLKTV